MGSATSETHLPDGDGSAERDYQATLSGSREIGHGEGRKQRHATATLNEALERFEIATLEAGDASARVSVRAGRAPAPCATLPAERDDLRPQAMPL